MTANSNNTKLDKTPTWCRSFGDGFRMPQSLLRLLTATAIAVALPGGTRSFVVARQAPPQVQQPVRNLRKPPAGLSVRGLVLDATTKHPVPHFRVIHGVPVGSSATWQPHLISSYERGLFEMPANTRAWEKTRFRVEADGYRPCISRVVLRSEGTVKLRFDLVPDPGIAALILTPAGQPAAGASAGWATLSREAKVLGAEGHVPGPWSQLGRHRRHCRLSRAAGFATRMRQWHDRRRTSERSGRDHSG